MTPTELATRLEELAAKATPGPMEVVDEGERISIFRGENCIAEMHSIGARSRRLDDANIISLVCNHLPAIISALRGEAAREALLEEAAAIAAQHGRAISKGTYRAAGPNDVGEQIAHLIRALKTEAAP